MSKSTSVRLDTDHATAITEMVDAGEADSPSEALRQTSQADLARRGYLSGGGGAMTGLRRGVRTVGSWFFLFAVAWVGVTYWYTIDFRLPAAALILSGLFCYGLDRFVLQRYEPGVTRRLNGGSAA
jgi:hypothetical protein